MGASLSRLTCSELTPLLALAKRNQRLEIEDIPPVQSRASCESVLKDFAGVRSDRHFPLTESISSY